MSGISKDEFVHEDRDDNEKSRLQENEDVELSCVWVCELFGPQEIANLYMSLQASGWDTGDYLLNRSAVTWIKNQRQYGYSGRYNLGFVKRQIPAGTPSSQCLIGDFPEEFSNLNVQIHQISPSLTCLLVCFQVADHQTNSYKAVLNQVFETSFTAIGKTRTIRISHVEQLKVKAVEDTFLRFRSSAVNWMNSKFPGYFFRTLNSTRQPTGELIAVVGFNSFEKPTIQNVNYQHWSNILKVAPHFEYWQHEKLKGLKFSQDRRIEVAANHLIVSVNWQLFPNSYFRFSDKNSSFSKVFHTNDEIQGVLVHFAALSFVREVRSCVTKDREGLSTSQKSLKGLNSQLAHIEKHFQNNIGVPQILNELNVLSKSNVALNRNVGGFLLKTNFNTKGRKARTTFPEVFSSKLESNIKAAISELADTREYFQELTSILGTKENVRTQRKMFWLTVVASVTAFASLIVAVFALKN